MSKIINIQGEHISPLERKMPVYYTLEIIQQQTQRVVHESARIWYVRKGAAQFYLNDHCYVLKAGNCVAIFPWDVTLIDHVEEELELHIIVYRFTAINAHVKLLEVHYNENEKLFMELKKTPIVQTKGQSLREMYHLVEQIGALQGCDSIYSSMEQESVLVQIICRMAQSQKVIALENEEVMQTSDTMLVLAVDVMQYMACHFNEKLTLDYVAQQFFTNKTTISKVLREVFSLTFVQMLSRMRLHKSVELLLTTADTLDEIAKQVGYFDSAHFTKQFETMYMLSPIAYRKKYVGTQMLPLAEIESVIEYIRNHFSDETIRAHQVAKRFSISATVLNTWMLFYTECTFDEWIHLLRMNYAARLLRTTSQTILDIAITVGYTNTRTFQRIFEQHFYTTPAQYRKV